MTETRFVRRGITKIYFASTITNISAPTLAEVTGGTDLSPHISAVEGFGWTNQPIETPDLGSTFVSKIAGPDQADDSSLEFYELREGSTEFTLLAKGTTGFLVFASAGGTGPGGQVAVGDKVDVFPFEVAGTPSKLITVDNEAAKFRVGVSLTAEPAQNVAIV